MKVFARSSLLLGVLFASGYAWSADTKSFPGANCVAGDGALLLSKLVQYEDKVDKTRHLIASARILTDGSELPFVEIYNCTGKLVETIYFHDSAPEKPAPLSTKAIQFFSTLQNGSLKQIRRIDSGGITGAHFEGDLVLGDGTKRTARLDDIRPSLKAEKVAPENSKAPSTH